MIKGIIFDLDGVIVTTDDYHYAAWKKLADNENIYFDREINNRLRGVSRLESLNIILEKADKFYSDQEKNILVYEKNKMYRDSLKKLSSKDVIPGILELLDFAKSKNLFLAIGSSSRNAKYILEKIKLDKAFDVIIDGNCISKSKPDPEVFSKACKELNLDPKDCIVIEDAISGIEAAKAAGTIAVAISSATESELADYRLNSIKDFKDLLIKELL